MNENKVRSNSGWLYQRSEISWEEIEGEKTPLGDEGGDGEDEKSRQGRKREKSEHTFATRNSIHQNPRPNFRAASDNLYTRPRIRPAFPIPNRDSVRELLQLGFAESRIRIEQDYTGRTYAIDANMRNALVPHPPHEEKNN